MPRLHKPSSGNDVVLFTIKLTTGLLASSVVQTTLAANCCEKLTVVSGGPRRISTLPKYPEFEPFQLFTQVR